MGIPRSLPSPKPRSLATAARRRPGRPQTSSEERQLPVYAGAGSPMTSQRTVVWCSASSRLCGLTQEGLRSFTGDRRTLWGTHKEGPPDMNEPERPDAEPAASPDRFRQSEVRRPDHGTPDPSREAIDDRGFVVIQRFSRHRQTGADHHH